MGRARKFALKQVPVSFRTLAFAFFIGSLLSLPIGMGMDTLEFRPFEPPEWTTPFWAVSFFCSLVILPFWSSFAFSKGTVLERFALAVILTFGVFILLALLFPAF